MIDISLQFWKFNLNFNFEYEWQQEILWRCVQVFLQNIPLEKERFAKISSLNLLELPLLKEKLNDKPVICLFSFWLDEIKQINSKGSLTDLINIWRPY